MHSPKYIGTWGAIAAPVGEEPNLSRIRARAFEAQGRRCYYCAVAMWLGDSGPFEQAFDIKPKAARNYRCTAEHLVAKGEGGGDHENNIVAACYFCNKRRHARGGRLGSNEFRELVRHRTQAGIWHPEWVYRLGLAPLDLADHQV